MKKVVLIGDSIRMGYQEVVGEELKHDAEIWAPTENGGDSRNVLAHIEEWALSKKPDVLHLNCGLHDLKTNRETGEKQVPLEEYRRNLEKIFASILSECPGTLLIWATITPVDSERHRRNKPFDRLEEDVARYNAAALEIAEKHGIPVDDLFKAVEEAGKERLLLPDGVHFTEEGYRLLGKTVAEFIKAHW